MLYIEKAKFSRELLNAKDINKEDILRSMVANMIRNMEIEDLKKIFQFNEFDPNTKESRQKIAEADYSGYTLETLFLKELRGYQLIGFEVSINTDKK